LTADVTQEAHDAALNAGMDACFTKPLSAEELEQLLEHELAGGTGRAAHAGPDGQRGCTAAELPLRDLAQALSATGGNARLLDEAVAALRGELPGALSALSEAIETQRWDELVARAHRLQGTASYCGVPALRRALADLEDAGRSGPRDLATGRQRLAVVQREMERLTEHWRTQAVVREEPTSDG
jgi:two-component system sensor histidine kinase BarA